MWRIARESLIVFCLTLETTSEPSLVSDVIRTSTHANSKSVFSVLFLQHLARNSRWHGKRVVVLTDSMATLYCVQKGRTSAANMKFGMNQIAALSIVCDFRVHPCYISTHFNPADYESRGRKRTSRPCATTTPSYQRYLHEVKRSARWLRSNGHIRSDSPCASWDSSCSSSQFGQPSII